MSTAPRTVDDVDRPRLERAKVATALAFAMNGIGYAGWFSRAPAVREHLGLSSAGFGLLLLCLAGAALVALPLSGPLVHRVGPARAILLATFAVVIGLVGLAAGTATGSVPLAAVALASVGLGTSTWDVAMNVHGADVERRLSRSLMPRFHAGWSLATVFGAGAGAACAALGVPVAAQVLAMAALVLIVMVFTVREFLPVVPVASDERASSGALKAWREPRTLLIGLVMLGFGFTEGSANDWLAITMVDGYGTSEAMGAATLAVFVTAMTVGRLLGGAALERWGRVPVLRVTAASALLGLLLVVSGWSLPLVILGTLLWGAGASLGFPVGMSAAADDPVRAAVRVSVASSIGYAAFLAGPPLIGFLSERTGPLRALLVVLGALAVGLAATGATRPLVPEKEPLR